MYTMIAQEECLQLYLHCFDFLKYRPVRCCLCGAYDQNCCVSKFSAHTMESITILEQHNLQQCKPAYFATTTVKNNRGKLYGSYRRQVACAV